ncbi:hypothetical protein FQR65_LT01958 [Abscondita terminalis]|nr:hypothetical protein FQR65_LT01958 [Abscondita terminalis]
MKFFLILIFSTCAFARTIQKEQPENKIVGGSIASKGQFPYMISLRFQRNHTCGGSIATNYLIVTAAHCVDGRPAEDFAVVAGSNKLNQDGLWVRISAIDMHMEWNPNTVANDVAVITLSNPITNTVLTQPIPLEKNWIEGGTPCVLSGWGITSYPGEVPNDLQYFEGTVLSLNDCKTALSENMEYPLTDGNVCAFAKEGVGACKGDSGSPLVANGKQIGIASWAVLCARGLPDVYANFNKIFLARTVQKVDPVSRIVGGSTAAKGQFPYQISLRFQRSHTCGGSIATEYLIVTAAHCVDGRPAENFAVVAGSNKLNQDGLWVDIAAIDVHEKWNPNTVENDLSIITLSYPIVPTVLTQPIPLETNEVSGGTPCVLSGWGLTSYPGQIPNDLQYFEGKVVSLDDCKAALSENLEFPILDTNICAFAKEGVGACSGDSGGPLVANGKQIGVVSWGVVCAKGVPDVYTKVSSYATWFRQRLAQSHH